MTCTPLELAIYKRDKARKRLIKFTTKAEAAHEQWIELSAEVVRLQHGGDQTDAAASVTRAATTPVMPARAFPGLISKVARELGVHRSHVSLVARGMRRSPRVEAALKTAMEEGARAMLSPWLSVEVAK